MDQSKFMFCYDKSLAMFLSKEKGIRYITHAVHPKTKQHFWQFFITSELDSAIQEWRCSPNGTHKKEA